MNLEENKTNIKNEEKENKKIEDKKENKDTDNKKPKSALEELKEFLREHTVKQE